MRKSKELWFLLGIALIAIGIATKVWAFVGAGAFFIIMSNRKERDR
ncbi:hypothetical protein [Pyrococcus yayanosii]|uniref:Uncharacterized protein n=1 Tax=Pyrococcus yayanosii (strain CH1 / JCM 16557) TaxID=529709 RepID=F8AEL3_PYRYC|nr:hypothetical protein [Pyrococcus yayanosii]AEH24692.1 hypothetical protein PYCH_10090 [Pyrococcus yayanosii CH1]